MYFFKKQTLLTLGLLLTLAACGGGGGGDDADDADDADDGGDDSGTSGGGDGSTTLSVTELRDPSPAAGNHFGRKVAILTNGNIAVTSPFDSSVAVKNGAVHLYDGNTKILIASLYGDNADDQLGSHGVVGLSNGNFVIASGFDDVNAISDAGSVRLMNGLTGAPIGTALVGDSTSELLGFNSSTPLPNGNYVVASGTNFINSSAVSAPVRLMSGVTGLQVGASIEGASPTDALGSGGITPLMNNNFVVLSPQENPASTVLIGTVRLINGNTGALIRLITSVDGASGEIRFGSSSISPVLIGSKSVIALANDNFVYSSGTSGLGATGSTTVFLVNGETGAYIGTPIGSRTRVLSKKARIFYTPLANNNYAITDVSPGNPDTVGYVRTIDGSSNVQFGVDYTGPTVGTLTPFNVGTGPVTALTNGNYVIGSQFDAQNSIFQSGAVSLVNSDVPALIGTAIRGNGDNDQLSGNGITALTNGNYVVSSSIDDVNSIGSAGSVFLANGETGVQIGTALVGNNDADQLGFANDSINGNSVTLGLNGATALANNNYVVASSYDTENGISSAGSVRLMNGATGVQIGATIAGETTSDLFNVTITGSSTGGFFLIAAPLWDNSGQLDAGIVRLIAE